MLDEKERILPTPQAAIQASPRGVSVASVVIKCFLPPAVYAGQRFRSDHAGVNDRAITAHLPALRQRRGYG